jgi:hypothetical protein
MGTRTAYQVRSNSPELGVYGFSFLGNGAAQPLATQIFGAKGLLQAPFSGTGINRTGVGLYTINLFDGFRGATGIGASTNQVYQALVGINVDCLSATGAGAFHGTPIFTGTDFLTAKQFKFGTAIENGTVTELTSSVLCCVTMFLLNSSAQ